MGYGDRTCRKLPGEDGPPVEFCAPPTSITNPKWSSEIRELFGERTGDVKACITTAPGARIKRVSCHMYNQYSSADSNLSPAERLKRPSCGTKFYDTSNCNIGWGAIHRQTNVINDKDQHVVCVEGMAEPNTGSRGWFIVAE
ncbi:hypothetical protein [Pelomonas sp. Root1217]|uniref:hypothetical protein n=1 Tax=Pelomonas sp. Root1217 TaxID=1736430 RepID=UPI0012F8D355|nr:hypothetical protein [Pelomonas sp. Root1217]